MKKAEPGYLDRTRPFDGTAMTETARDIANAQLERVEALIDLAFLGAGKIWAIALLIAQGFEFMRHKVRISDASAASTRLVG